VFYGRATRCARRRRPRPEWPADTRLSALNQPQNRANKTFAHSPVTRRGRAPGGATDETSTTTFRASPQHDALSSPLRQRKPSKIPPPTPPPRRDVALGLRTIPKIAFFYRGLPNADNRASPPCSPGGGRAAAPGRTWSCATRPKFRKARCGARLCFDALLPPQPPQPPKNWCYISDRLQV